MDLFLTRGGYAMVDKFVEMMQKTQKMSKAEFDEQIEKSRAICICGKCPTYNSCMKENHELLYCFTGKSTCRDIPKKACICPTCPISRALEFKHAYFCVSGSEREQRKM
jgi:hypothetical protein